MFNLISKWGNANENYNELTFHTYQCGKNEKFDDMKC